MCLILFKKQACCKPSLLTQVFFFKFLSFRFSFVPERCIPGSLESALLISSSPLLVSRLSELQDCELTQHCSNEVRILQPEKKGGWGTSIKAQEMRPANHSHQAVTWQECLQMADKSVAVTLHSEQYSLFLLSFGRGKN